MEAIKIAEKCLEYLKKDEPIPKDLINAARSAESAAWSARSAESAARSAAWSAESAAESAESAAWSAARLATENKINKWIINHIKKLKEIK